jgi:DNA-directed RNA polymerase specialized sigma24 family protein
MPERRKRTGSRAGAMSGDIRAALDAEVARLAALDDPISQVRAVGDFFAALDEELEKVAEVRLAAVTALRRQGMSYDRIAEATGLSKPRVAQLSRDAKVGGRRPRPAKH